MTATRKVTVVALRFAAAEMARVAVERRPWTSAESELWHRVAVAAANAGVTVPHVPADDETTTAADLSALAEAFLRAAARLEDR